jgi:transposase
LKNYYTNEKWSDLRVFIIFLFMGGEGRTQPHFVSLKTILNAVKAGPQAVISLITFLSDTIARLTREIDDLRKKNQELEAKLHVDSHNSSKPPSSDGPRKRKLQEKRKKSKRKPGAQKGHPGRTLDRIDNPDRYVVHRVTKCAVCGKDLSKHRSHDHDRRQVFDIKPITAQVTEHWAEITDCDACGHTNVASYPDGVRQKTQYGPTLKSHAVYFSSYNLIPFRRTAELFEDIFRVPFSEGTVVNTISAFARKAEPTVEQIKELLEAADVVGFDETGIRINAKLNWIHVAGTQTLTYYAVHEKRGTKAMEAIGILPVFQGTAIHDGLTAYWTYRCLHGLCNAHHLRELTFLWEEEKQGWAKRMISFLLEAKELVEKAKAKGRTKLAEEIEQDLKKRYRQLVGQGLRANPPPVVEGPKKRGRVKKSKGRNFVERLERYADETLRFTCDFRVPFTNNGEERDLRMVKVQQKISGTFRSVWGASAFCVIRSYISTARKQGLNVIEAISSVFKGQSLLLFVLQNS